MKIEKNSKLTVIFSLYCSTLFLGWLFPISNYNYVFTSIFFICILSLFKLKQTFYELTLLTFFSLFILLYTNANILYMISDILTFGFVFHLLNIANRVDVNLVCKHLNIVKKISIVYLFLNLIASLISNYYIIDTMSRFTGLFQGANSSLSVLILLIIIVWEICKIEKRHFFSLVILFFIYLYFCFITHTRTGLLGLPYFLYQFYLFNKKRSLVIFFIFIFIFASISYLNWEQIRITFRFDENESSYQTRRNIYHIFFDKLQEDFFLIPNGFNSSTAFIRSTVFNEKYSVHNDFIRYLYDLGGFFFLILLTIVVKMKPFLNFNILFLLMFLISTSLHNILFIYYIWIPVFFILLITKNKIQETL